MSHEIMYSTDNFKRDIQSSEGRKFIEKRTSLEDITKVTQQTMHDVFYLSGNPGVYVKISKSKSDGEKDKREMDTESLWYTLFKNKLNLPGAPEAITFELGNEYALAVEEVKGKTYDQVFKTEIKREDVLRVLEKSAEITARCYKLHLENPNATPAYFGEFDNKEIDFLNGRTLKILRANNISIINSLESLLNSTKVPLTTKENELFYRDATPLNWVETEAGVVAIDLGSTSYRAPQFELIAFQETPNSGVGDISEEWKKENILLYRDFLKASGADVFSHQEFQEIYSLASIIKNASGTASRIQHIHDNKKIMETGNEEDKNIAKQRLVGNISGRDFHLRRLNLALTNSYNFFEKSGVGNEFKTVMKEFFKQFSQE